MKRALHSEGDADSACVADSPGSELVFGAVEGERCASLEVAQMLECAKQTSRKYEGKTLRKTANNRPLTYGELKPELVSRIVWQLQAGPQDIMIDIGSGIGNLCFHFALETGCRAHGVEIRKDLHAIAEDVGHLLYADLNARSKAAGQTTLWLGDVTRPTESFIACLREATIVICNNVVFSDALDIEILKLLKANLRVGARVVMFKNGFPRNAPSCGWLSSLHPLSFVHVPPHRFMSEPMEASWTNSRICYFVYVTIEQAPPFRCLNARGRVFAKFGSHEAEKELEQLTLWRARCEEIAVKGINEAAYKELLAAAEFEAAEAQPARSKPAKGEGKRKGARTVVPPVKAPRPAPQVHPKRPRWDYIEEIAFILPPSPPRVRGSSARVFRDEIQLSDSKNQLAIIRQRPRSPSPIRTRRQRKETGKEVVELKKLVIWQERPNARHDDFCGICMQGGELMMCDGSCWRSFHVACVGLETLPEGDWFCDCCNQIGTFDGECGVCGEAGKMSARCGSCERVFHGNCVGLVAAAMARDFVCGHCVAPSLPFRQAPPRPDEETPPQQAEGTREFSHLAASPASPTVAAGVLPDAAVRVDGTEHDPTRSQLPDPLVEAPTLLLSWSGRAVRDYSPPLTLKMALNREYLIGRSAKKDTSAALIDFNLAQAPDAILVSRRHALLRWNGSELQLCVLGFNGVYQDPWSTKYAASDEWLSMGLFWHADERCYVLDVASVFVRVIVAGAGAAAVTQPPDDNDRLRLKQ